MAYAKEHSALIRSPVGYASFTRADNAFGKGIDAVYGVLGTRRDLQSIRFRESAGWTYETAEDWLAQEGIKYKRLERALRMRTRNPTNPHARYVQSHWGVGPDTEYRINDACYPRQMVEMGKLRELHVRTNAGEHVLEMPARDDVILAFTSDAAQRLYPVIPLDLRGETRALIDDEGEWYDLQEVADAVGGRQARYKLPKMDVQALGMLTNVVYLTEKGRYPGSSAPDDWSEYKHRMGEHGGVEPALCVDSDGRLWIAGGSYTVPNAGITR